MNHFLGIKLVKHNVSSLLLNLKRFFTTLQNNLKYTCDYFSLNIIIQREGNY